MTKPSLPRLLIVEPDEEARCSVAELLEGKAEVLAVPTAAEALPHLEEDPPRALLVALAVDRLSALELIHNARKLEDPPRIAAMVDANDGISIVEGYDLGVEEVLGKPVKAEAIAEWLEVLEVDDCGRKGATPRELYRLARRLRSVASMSRLGDALRSILSGILDACYVSVTLPAGDTPVRYAGGQALSEAQLTQLSTHLLSMWRSQAGPIVAWNFHDGLNGGTAEPVQTDDALCFASAPLVLRGEHAGFLTLAPREGTIILRHHLNALFVTAEILAARIECLVYEAEAESVEASYDSLTGLLNHGTFMTRLKDQALHAHHSSQPLSVLVIDLDDLTAINERCGHTAGDTVLKHSGRMVLATARKTDAVGRLGGDEYAVLLPQTDLDGALRYAERIRRALAANLIRVESHEVSVTASVGVVTAVPEIYDAEALMEWGLRTARKAFERGGNQVVAATVEDPEEVASAPSE
ncbi:GGDEF domain-containing response regulator [bacterium]|nr:GGDEF domain-containing response regulator [bacterium]